jgi:hypothetical protein
MTTQQSEHRSSFKQYTISGATLVAWKFMSKEQVIREIDKLFSLYQPSQHTISPNNEKIPCCENCANNISIDANGKILCKIEDCTQIPYNSWINKYQQRHIKARGCLSHPLAREYLNRDIIEELEGRLNTTCKQYHDTPPYLSQGNIN